jgi:hypothetical protein
MELAIPFIALGGLYMASKYSNRKYEEGMTSPIASSGFPGQGQGQGPTPLYSSQEAAANEYRNQELYEEWVRQGREGQRDIPQIFSQESQEAGLRREDKGGWGLPVLEGQGHNNMVHYYPTNKDWGPPVLSDSTSRLDTLMGSGSQLFRKAEQGPLFAPESNVQWAWGMPNQSEFLQSREVAATRNHGVRPFDPVNVAPALNGGYNGEGRGGFNSGMEQREVWQPKNVDDLRVLTNPKLEYSLEGLEGSAGAFNPAVSGSEILGLVEKRRPDTYYDNTPDRWFTTVGEQQGNHARPEQMFQAAIRKPNTDITEYRGAAASTDWKAARAPENYEAPKHAPLLGALAPNPSHAVGRGPLHEQENTHVVDTTHRSSLVDTHGDHMYRSGFSKAMGAVVSPLLDAFRPTRKDETVYNVSVVGEKNIKTYVPNSYVINPLDVLKTTMKETTLYTPVSYINNQQGGNVIANVVAPDRTQREGTSTEYFAPGGAIQGAGRPMVYDSFYQAPQNETRSLTIQGYTPNGGMQVFQPHVNLTTLRDDQEDRFSGHVNPPFSRIAGATPSVSGQTLKAPLELNQNIQMERNTPDILSAFLSNPYTQSLTSSA